MIFIVEYGIGNNVCIDAVIIILLHKSTYYGDKTNAKYKLYHN